MKKVLAILLVLVVAMTGVMATEAGTVNLMAKVAESDYIPTLYYNYNSDGVTFVVAETAIYESATGSTPWDLLNTSEATTNYFVVKVSGDQLETKSIKLSVSASNFIGKIADGSDYSSDSGVNVSVKSSTGAGFESSGASLRGQKDKSEIGRFVLSWTGKENLPAGDYQSTVTLSYTTT